MLPLRDDQRLRHVPIVTFALITANVVIYLYQATLGPELRTFIYHYGLVPALLWNSGGERALGEALMPFFTSMFLHGGFLHLGGNMWFLWIFGNKVEDRLRRMRFLGFYIVAGLAGAAAQVLTAPHSPIPMVGASGAISGVLAGYMLLFPTARIVALLPIFFFLTVVRLPAFFFLGYWFLIQLFSGLGSLGGVSGGTAWFAHVGGFVAGLLLVKFLDKGPPRPRIRRPRYFDNRPFSA